MIEGLKICGISDPKTLNYILNHPNPPKFIGFITNYTKSKKKKLWVIPLPTKYKLSYWLTLEYVFPKRLVDFIFNFVSKKCDQFYLLIHPADFLDYRDVKDFTQKPNLERMEVLIEEKINIFEKRLKELTDKGFEVKTFISHYKN